MTRHEVQGVLKHLDCAKAYVEGKTIQRLYNDGTWRDTGDTNFHYEAEYRVKPKPGIVPFESMAEFCKAWDGEPLTDKDPKSLSLYKVKEINCYGLTLEPSGIWSWSNLASAFLFSDGTPCGKEVAE